MVTAAYRLGLHQLRFLRLLRDSRPCRVTPRDTTTYFKTVRHLGRLGLVEYTGSSGTWSATITIDGVHALRREDARVPAE